MVIVQLQLWIQLQDLTLCLGWRGGVVASISEWGMMGDPAVSNASFILLVFRRGCKLGLLLSSSAREIE